MRPLKFLPVMAGLGIALGSAGCLDGPESADESNNALTSNTALAGKITFEGVVYVNTGLPDAFHLDDVKGQTKSAFGALLRSEISAQTRELSGVQESDLKKRKVKVIDPKNLSAPPTEVWEVRYKYTDNVVFPKKLANKKTLDLALLGSGYNEKLSEVIDACVARDDADAKGDSQNGFLWYYFQPNQKPCKDFIKHEQSAIDKDEKAIARRPGAGSDEISTTRRDRAIVPVKVSLEATATATTPTYPEYNRLFAGPSEPGVLKISLLSGKIAHGVHVETRKDSGYSEWLSALQAIFKKHPEFELRKIDPDPGNGLSTSTVNGRTYTGLSIHDVINWTLTKSGWPKKMPTEDRDDIERDLASPLDSTWLTFEKNVTVKIGAASPKPLTIRLQTFFGATDDDTPHRLALKNSDVFIYNGHSYLGSGPLDPINYVTADFTSSYQLLWFDSCISYNYYNKDFFSLKANGSKDLDLISNGLEAPDLNSGEGEGLFIAELIGGKQPSYQTLLQQASLSDSLRVVEGEVDNGFNPSRTAITITK